MPVRKRGNSWQADVLLEDGRRMRRSFQDRASAEGWHKAVSSGMDTEQVETSLKGFASANFRTIWKDVKSARSIEINLGVLYKYLGADTPLSSITPMAIDRMVRRMGDDGKSGGTINRKLAVLSKLLKKAASYGIISTVPQIERQKEGKARQRVLTSVEEQQVLAWAEHTGLDTFGNVVTFLLYTGCRVGELYRLTSADISLPYVTFRDTKNGESRTIKLPKRAEDALLFLLFQDDNAGALGHYPRDTFRAHWDRLRDAMAPNDPEFVPHMLRHTCATRLVQAGVPLPNVAKFLGHKSIQVTMRYSHLVSTDTDICASALERRTSA